MWRSTPSWQAISANRHPSAGRFMSNQQSLGMQLAQLGRDASAAVSNFQKITWLVFFIPRVMVRLVVLIFWIFLDVFFPQGAARRVTTQRKLVEVESVGVAGKSDSKRTVKYFRLEVRQLSVLWLQHIF